MSEESRHSSQRPILEVLRAMMEGEVLDRFSDIFRARYGIRPEAAYRWLNLLAQVVPGVKTQQRERRKVFRFDVSAFRDDGTHRATASGFTEALAASFASAFARVFTGTRYEHRLREHRAAVIADLAAMRKKHFAHIGRKVFVRSGQEELLAEQEELLDDVLDAVLRQRRARMLYRRFSGQEERVELEPYSIVVYAAHLYVVGATATVPYYPFRFARILEFEATADHFEYPSPNKYDPEVVFRDSLGIFVDPEPCDVRIRLDPRWSVYARHHRWHSSQRIESELDDGSLEMTMRVRPCNELKQWLLGLGEHAEVLAPEELRIEIAERLQRAARRYEHHG
jgi:predicted DNA-binding transcriptional regulator YafY